MVVTKPVLAGVVVGVLVASFTIGILIGIFGVKKPDCCPHHVDDDDGKIVDVNGSDESDEDFDEDDMKILAVKITNKINGTKIFDHVRFMSNISHVAGTAGNKKVMEYIYNYWEDELENLEVEKFSYDVLLSYADEDISNRNQVQLFDKTTDAVVSYSREREPIVKMQNPEFPLAYHAYSPSTTVEGRLVYANFATDQDFQTLRDHGVNVTGTIIIARAGKIFLGNKILLAARNGAVGVIVYPDPEETLDQVHSDEAEHDEDTASPEVDEVTAAEKLPDDGLQRGTVFEKIGDPLTPGYPAMAGAPRIKLENANLPTIPSQPVDYTFAKRIMTNLGGPDIKDDKWKGGIHDLSYRAGYDFEGDDHNCLIRMNIHNKLETKQITNVIARIDGDIEPDRYVILGNAYDAWGYGAINPSSSTAQLLEITRVFNKLIKTGWKPRRTIIFAAWDAGKFGQIGSTEWVEQHLDTLSSRTVAYINTESCIETDDLKVSSLPLLEQAALNAAKYIFDEDNPKQTLYDDWYEEVKSKEETSQIISSLGAESDHAAFAFYAGIPSIDVHSQREDNDGDFYPRQNTRYDVMEVVEAVDKNRSRSVSCAQYIAVLTAYLAETSILPYNVEDMANVLVKEFEKYDKSAVKIEAELKERNITTFDDLGLAINKFHEEAVKFQENMDEVDLENPLAVRMINDQLMLIERAFIKPTGDSDDWFHRHLLYGPTDSNKHADSVMYMFEELIDQLDDVEEEESEEEREDKTGVEEADNPEEIKVTVFWDKLRQYIHDVEMALKEATKILQPIPGVYDLSKD